MLELEEIVKKHIKLLSILLLLSQMVTGQNWVQTSGPRGNQVYALLKCENRIYLGGDHGVFISDNGGINWKELNGYNMSPSPIPFLTSNGTLLYKGSEEGIYRLYEDGFSWIPVNYGLPQQPFSLKSLITSGSYIYAAIGKNIYISTNNGGSWLPVDNELVNTYVSTLTSDGSVLYAAYSGGKVCYSNNHGGDWIMVNLSASCTINSLLVVDTNLFAGTSSGIFRLNSLKTSWTPVNNGLPEISVTTLCKRGGNIYAGTRNGGVFYSSDRGSHWAPCNNGLQCIDIRLITGIDSCLFAGTSAALFRSTDEGAHWSTVYKDFPFEYINKISVVGIDLISTSNFGGIHESGDRGDSWLLSSKGIPGDYNTGSVIKHGDRLYVSQEGNGILASDNYGKDWYPLINGLTDLCISSLVSNGSHVFTGSRHDGVFKLNDSGTDWISASSGLNDSAVYSLFAEGNSLYAGTSTGIYFSGNEGMSWIKRSTGLDATVTAFTAVDSIIFAGTDDKGVYVSSDHGLNWYDSNNGLGGMKVYSLVSKGKQIYAAIAYVGIFFSEDYGANWRTFDAGFFPNGVSSIAILGHEIFAGYSGVWKSHLYGIPQDDNSIKVYPNPATDYITIEIAWDGQPLKLSVSDVSGRLVYQSDVNDEKTIIDVSALPQGLYIIKVADNKSFSMKKLVKY